MISLSLTRDKVHVLLIEFAESDGESLFGDPLVVTDLQLQFHAGGSVQGVQVTAHTPNFLSVNTKDFQSVRERGGRESERKEA